MSRQLVQERERLRWAVWLRSEVVVGRESKFLEEAACHVIVFLSPGTGIK